MNWRNGSHQIPISSLISSNPTSENPLHSQQTAAAAEQGPLLRATRPVEPELRQPEESGQSQTEIQEPEEPTDRRQRPPHYQGEGAVFERAEKEPGLTRADAQVDQTHAGADGAVPGGRQERPSVRAPRGGGDQARAEHRGDARGGVRYEGGDELVRCEA